MAAQKKKKAIIINKHLLSIIITYTTDGEYRHVRAHLKDNFTKNTVFEVLDMLYYVHINNSCGINIHSLVISIASIHPVLEYISLVSESPIILA